MELSNNINSFGAKKELVVDEKKYSYFHLEVLESNKIKLLDIPYSIKILLENLLRHEDGVTVKAQDIINLLESVYNTNVTQEINFRPARVLSQDFTGVPAMVDLAAMRDIFLAHGGDPKEINPLIPVDLIIDHSVMVDQFGSNQAFIHNVQQEYARNKERYTFLKWGQLTFDNFRVIPPGTGICHQINLEYLAKVVWQNRTDNEILLYPDTVVGTDSHTTMINGLGILGWGVGGIEAEAAMLGQPISMTLPEVVGLEISGSLKQGVTATDVVLKITDMLRQYGVVGKFVEFYGSGISALSLAERATIANMAPEYGATCGIFPIDQETLNYLRLTNRDQHTINIVREYAKKQQLWYENKQYQPKFAHHLTLDLTEVDSCLAGPKRPQDNTPLREMDSAILEELPKNEGLDTKVSVIIDNCQYDLRNGDLVIAAITSCTNTSNPYVMLGAGLLAKKACEKGLFVKPWVKTSLAPGSQVVTDYLQKAQLQSYLDQLGFNLVGYGCTTCIGNSGNLIEAVANAIQKNNMSVCAILSGNRNFEGRIHQQVKLSYLASPMLVVAYALTGTLRINLYKDKLGTDKEGNAVYLQDIWPTSQEINDLVKQNISPNMFEKSYANVFKGDKQWEELSVKQSLTFDWQANSTYIRRPNFFDNIGNSNSNQDIKGARIIALLGDSVTTDHISPTGAIAQDSTAGKYLLAKGIPAEKFNSYGARRGNHEVMMRGTFANICLKNEMCLEKLGGFTRLYNNNEIISIFNAAMYYQEYNIPLVIFAGKEYGTGSSRDWAAKGPKLLGIKVIIAESFERIHRSNLIGMGILPCEYTNHMTRQTLNLNGSEEITIIGIADNLTTGKLLQLSIQYADGQTCTSQIKCRLDTQREVDYYKNGGILNYLLNSRIN